MGRSAICGGFLGTTFDARHWMSLDFCGLACVSVSHFVLLYSWSVVWSEYDRYVDVNDEYGVPSIVTRVLYYGLYVPFTVMALASLGKAFTTDPGAVPLGARPLLHTDRGTRAPPHAARGVRRCRKCNNNYKPPRAHHDSNTGRCVVKMDHYCPWVCNAVGALNHKFFFLFVLYTFLTCVTSSILICLRIYRCFESSHDNNNYHDHDQDHDHNHDHDHDHDDVFVIPDEGNKTNHSIFMEGVRYLISNVTGPNQTSSSSSSSSFGVEMRSCYHWSRPSMILVVCTLVFMAFTFCMLTEQIEAIQSNVSKIARMKRSRGDAEGEELGRVTTRFNELFGGDSPRVTWHWFLPLSIQFPDGMNDLVMGYRYDPSWTAVYQPGDDDDNNDDDDYHNDETDNANNNDHDLELQLDVTASDVEGHLHTPVTDTTHTTGPHTNSTSELSESSTESLVELSTSGVKRRQRNVSTNRNDSEEKMSLLLQE